MVTNRPYKRGERREIVGSVGVYGNRKGGNVGGHWMKVRVRKGRARKGKERQGRAGNFLHIQKTVINFSQYIPNNNAGCIWHLF
jgi:hypothetical protein